jgi:hypothetical protein
LFVSEAGILSLLIKANDAVMGALFEGSQQRPVSIFIRRVSDPMLALTPDHWHPPKLLNLFPRPPVELAFGYPSA